MWIYVDNLPHFRLIISNTNTSSSHTRHGPATLAAPSRSYGELGEYNFVCFNAINTLLDEWIVTKQNEYNVGAAAAGGGHGDVPGGDPLGRLHPDPAGLLARPGQAEDRHLRVTRDCHADSSHQDSHLHLNPVARGLIKMCVCLELSKTMLVAEAA